MRVPIATMQTLVRRRGGDEGQKEKKKERKREERDTVTVTKEDSVDKVKTVAGGPQALGR